MDRDPNIFTLGTVRYPDTEIPSFTKTVRLYPGKPETEETREEGEEMGKALVVVGIVVAVVAIAYFLLYKRGGRGRGRGF